MWKSKAEICDLYEMKKKEEEEEKEECNHSSFWKCINKRFYFISYS